MAAKVFGYLRRIPDLPEFAKEDSVTRSKVLMTGQPPFRCMKRPCETLPLEPATGCSRVSWGAFSQLLRRNVTPQVNPKKLLWLSTPPLAVSSAPASSPMIQKFRLFPGCWIQDWRTVWSSGVIVKAWRSPEFQTMLEYWRSLFPSVAGQWYCWSRGSEPPMQVPMPLVGPFTSQVSYL